MKRISIAVLSAALAVSAATHFSFGDAPMKGPNEDNKSITSSDKTKGVETADVAGKLAAWARENKDPVELASAARVLASAPPTDMKNPKKEAKDTETDAKAAKLAPFTPEALLKEARALAGDNKEQLAAIDAIEQTMPQTRGHAGGAVVDRDLLQPGGSMDYTLTFEGGEPMEIAVVSYGSSSIDWHVYDQNGNEITSVAADHFANTPRWTGQFHVVLRNKTKSPLSYALATN